MGMADVAGAMGVAPVAGVADAMGRDDVTAR
jgi:hypothetical protein